MLRREGSASIAFAFLGEAFPLILSSSPAHLPQCLYTTRSSHACVRHASLAMLSRLSAALACGSLECMPAWKPA